MIYYESTYYGTLPLDVDRIEHHGIKGQKWGVRRFQNPDGSLTAAGKKRYGTVENFNKSREKRRETIKKVAKGAAVAGGVALTAYALHKHFKDTGALNKSVKDLGIKTFQPETFKPKTFDPESLKPENLFKNQFTESKTTSTSSVPYGGLTSKQREILRQRYRKLANNPDTSSAFKSFLVDQQIKLNAADMGYDVSWLLGREKKRNLKQRISGMDLVNMSMADLKKLDLW